MDATCRRKGTRKKSQSYNSYAAHVHAILACPPRNLTIKPVVVLIGELVNLGILSLNVHFTLNCKGIRYRLYLTFSRALIPFNIVLGACNRLFDRFHMILDNIMTINILLPLLLKYGFNRHNQSLQSHYP